MKKMILSLAVILLASTCSFGMTGKRPHIKSGRCPDIAHIKKGCKECEKHMKHHIGKGKKKKDIRFCDCMNKKGGPKKGHMNACKRRHKIRK